MADATGGGPVRPALASPADPAPAGRDGHATITRPEGVPYLDLHPVNEPLREAILADFARAMDHGRYLGGPEVARFEAAFAAYCGVAHGVGVASGLDAIRLALLAAGLRPGDEVIVPGNTFVATFEAVVQAGGVPRVADVTETDYNIDVAAARALISPRTRALLPVHLYGQMADMRALAALAHAHDLIVVEDAAQAHGARRAGLRAGAIGQAGAFSFYPTKNLGAMGDAGAIVTPESGLAARAGALREHGQTVKHTYVEAGYTSRLDTLQAIVLLHKLPGLDEANRRRGEIAAHYTAALRNVGDLGLPPVAEDSEPVWHVYAISTAEPARLGAFLQEREIGSARHYPVPVHLSPGWVGLGLRRGALPVTERLAGRLVSLPIYAGMTEGQCDKVVDGARAYFSG
jgi:dTDP-4-amino-4,6-dideoxygalactose transaminase